MYTGFPPVETQDRSIAFAERAAAFFREKRDALCRDSRAERGCRAGSADALQERASTDFARRSYFVIRGRLGCFRC
jgi:hypothetical protein